MKKFSGLSRRLSDAQFRDAVREARDRYSISELIGRHTALKMIGSEARGLCVFHDERTPSLYVNDATGLYHCFGCGASGDAIRFIMETEGGSFIEAVQSLSARDLRIVPPEERARRAAENAQTRAAAIEEAQQIWRAAVPTSGTDAERYAQGRGITMPLPESLRFGMTHRWRDRETGETGPDTPAMVGAVTKGDELVAVQCIFLRDHGRAKALGKRPKLSRGRILGGALRLDQGRPASPEVIITEGPEDALSLAQEFPDRRVWACLGTAMMPAVEFPDHIRRIVIAGQNDEAGRIAVQAAAARLVERGFEVGTMWPAPGFKDWNDQLRGIRK